MITEFKRENFREAYTAVFLLDSNSPQKIVLLKRASWKKFAPNQYTGIGGTSESGETADDCAKRELREETGMTGLNLNRFAQCIVGDIRIIDYYWAIFTKKLPKCNEGSLEWVELTELNKKPIIEATAFVLTEWSKRKFNLNENWTLYVSLTKPDNHDWSGRKLERIENGISLV